MASDKDKAKKKIASTTQRAIATIIDGALMGVIISIAYTTSNSVLTCLMIPFGYYFITESIWDRTIGKMILGIMVIDAKKDVYDENNMLLKVFLRTICRYTVLDYFSFMFNDHGHLWHDQVSNTIVINKKSLPDTYFE